MHITLMADYAVRIVDTLARADGIISAKTIAERACVTQLFTLRILHKLVSCGIVRSHRGTYGGYEMAVPIDKLSVFDVLSAIEGDIVLNRCLLEKNTCTRVPDKMCPYHMVFKELTETVCNKLASITFADVLAAEK